MRVRLTVEKGDCKALENFLNILTDERHAAYCGRIRVFTKTFDDDGIVSYIKGKSMDGRGP